jgi:hypothetical protein
MTEPATAVAKLAFTAHRMLTIAERCRLISARKNIQHNVRYTELSQDRFNDFRR